MNNNKDRGLFTSLLQLGKIKISIPVALTGFLGYFRLTGTFDLSALFTIAGILFLSMGSSTFNHIQERKTDKLMERTRTRPLPSGRVSLSTAVIAGICWSLTGFMFIFLTGSLTAAAIGVFTFTWYNLVYTPLKKVTPFAVLPGAIIGALPPLIGWTAAGGDLLNREILLISYFLFIGQMPHYWLLLMKVGHEFKDAGLPVITEVFSKHQLRNISFTWIIAAALSLAIFPVSGIIQNYWLAFLMLGIIVLFLIRMFIFIYRNEIMEKWKQAFITVNLFYLFIILLLIADKLSVPYLYSNYAP